MRDSFVHGRVIRSPGPNPAQGLEDSSPSFEELFHREYTRLAKALYVVTRDPEVADDLAQDALVRVYERWEKVRNMRSRVGYLYRVALNLNRSRLLPEAGSGCKSRRPSAGATERGVLVAGWLPARADEGDLRGQRRTHHLDRSHWPYESHHQVRRSTTRCKVVTGWSRYRLHHRIRRPLCDSRGRHCPSAGHEVGRPLRR